MLQTIRNINLFSDIATCIETHRKTIRYIILFINSVLFSLLVYLLSLRFNILDFYILAFDIIRIIFSSLIFIKTWNNYSRDNQEVNYLGFGFLVILVGSMLFICTYSAMDFSTPLYQNLKNNNDMVSRFAKAIILFFCLSGILRFKLKRLNLFIITILISVTFYLSIHVFTTIFPHTLKDYAVIINLNKSVTYLVINSLNTIFLSCCILITTKKIGNLKYRKMSYSYISLGLLASLLNSICFTLYVFDISYFLILGYLLESISYFFFFKAFHFDKVIDVNRTVANVIPCSQNIDCMEKFLMVHPNAVVIFNKDLKLKFINAKLENLLGYRLDELHDLHLLTILENFSVTDSNSCLIVSFINLENIYDILLSEKEKIISIFNRFNERIIFMFKPHILSNGSILFMLTENNTALEIENIKLQTDYILNSINSYIVIIDKNKKVVSCNKLFHELTGIKPGNAIGMTLKQVSKSLNLKFINSLSIKKQFASAHFKAREVIIDSADKEKKHILFRISPVKDIGNNNSGYIIVGSDITFLKEEQQNVQQQEKLAIIGQLGSGIVHETKNMLASIKGHCQLINLKSDNDYVKSHINRIEEITNDLNKIITEFLALSKPTSHIFNTVFLNVIILSVKYMLESPSFIRGVKLELDLTEHEKPVYADEFQIKQVILNMAKNAIEAMEETKSPFLLISTSLSSSNKEMIIKVSDNGKGFPKEDLPKIFEPFYTTKEYGTGLGLDTCYRIIKEHNGRISVESEIGKGTSFTISIPCKSNIKQI